MRGNRYMTDVVVPAATEPASRFSDVCLATATSEAFLPGAMTTVASFLGNHPGFGGEVVVIHDGLSALSCGHLEALSDRVRVEPVSQALRERLARLSTDHGGFNSYQLAQFYSLDAFRLTGYRKVLFCDADLLFREPIPEVFDARADLLCCADHAHLEGRFRDMTTFRVTDAEGALSSTFNSGFMLIDARMLGEGPFSDGCGSSA